MSIQLLTVDARGADEDHLIGYKIKDAAGVQPPGLYDLSNQQYFGPIAQGCQLKKPKFLLLQGDKNGGDDPRGRAPGNFLCYKAKCSTPIALALGEDQFSAAHSVEIKKSHLVCAPFVDPTLPRFVDNGDGTVTDHETHLIWEKKVDIDVCVPYADCAIHDQDDTYPWSATGTAPDGGAFTDFLGTLNGGTSPDGTTISGCFTGHCDWRLPTFAELNTIQDLTAPGCGGGSPCIYAEFGPTTTGGYWSSITFASDTSRAWDVEFDGGNSAAFKSWVLYVRAVRSSP